MGYKQFTEIKITNSTGGILRIQGAALTWGKYYTPGDRDSNISADDLNTVEIANNGEYTVAACGRSDSASGCTGSFELKDGDAPAVKITFESPWGASPNRFSATASGKFAVRQSGGNFNNQGGPLGLIDLVVGKF